MIAKKEPRYKTITCEALSMESILNTHAEMGWLLHSWHPIAGLRVALVLERAARRGVG